MTIKQESVKGSVSFFNPLSEDAAIAPILDDSEKAAKDFVYWCNLKGNTYLSPSETTEFEGYLVDAINSEKTRLSSGNPSLEEYMDFYEMCESLEDVLSPLLLAVSDGNFCRDAFFKDTDKPTGDTKEAL